VAVAPLEFACLERDFLWFRHRGPSLMAAGAVGAAAAPEK